MANLVSILIQTEILGSNSTKFNAYFGRRNTKQLISAKVGIESCRIAT